MMPTVPFGLPLQSALRTSKIVGVDEEAVVMQSLDQSTLQKKTKENILIFCTCCFPNLHLSIARLVYVQT